MQLSRNSAIYLATPPHCRDPCGGATSPHHCEQTVIQFTVAPMPSYTDSDIPGAFLPYWRQALDRSPDEAKRLMAQFICDLSDILLRTEGAKEGQKR